VNPQVRWRLDYRIATPGLAKLADVERAAEHAEQ
jgi:hypothetical protein